MLGQYSCKVGRWELHNRSWKRDENFTAPTTSLLFRKRFPFVSLTTEHGNARLQKHRSPFSMHLATATQEKNRRPFPLPSRPRTRPASTTEQLRLFSTSGGKTCNKPLTVFPSGWFCCRLWLLSVQQLPRRSCTSK